MERLNVQRQVVAETPTLSYRAVERTSQKNLKRAPFHICGSLRSPYGPHPHPHKGWIALVQLLEVTFLASQFASERAAEKCCPQFPSGP